MKRKVILVVRWPVGGIRTYLRYVYRLFAGSKWEFVAVVAKTPETAYLCDDIGSPLVDLIECEADSVSMIKAVRDAMKKHDTAIVHSHGLGAAICSSVGLLGIRVPHLVTLHDVFLPTHFSGIVGLLRRLATNFMLRRVTYLHLISDDQRTNLFEYFPKENARMQDRVSIIKSGIEVERFSSTPFTKESSQTGPKELGFFGRFMAQKGFGLLVLAIEQLHSNCPERDIPTVVCVGSGGYLDREKRNIDELGLSSYFRFEPFVSNPANLMRQMDGIVMPSRWEAVGLLAMESLVLGVPLLASRCIGLREVIHDTPSFAFEADSVPSLVEAMQLWMRDDKRKEFEAYAPKACKRFDVARTQQGLEQLYVELVS